MQDRNISNREKIKFERGLIINTMFNGKTLKLNFFVLKILTIYLAPTGWDISSFGTCKKIENLDAKAEKLKKKEKRTDGSLSRFFFFWRVRKVYQDNGKICAIRWRPASVQKEAKCALCLVGTNRRGAWQISKNWSSIKPRVQRMGRTNGLCKKKKKEEI